MPNRSAKGRRLLSGLTGVRGAVFSRCNRLTGAHMPAFDAPSRVSKKVSRGFPTETCGKTKS
jgi:hypothetical protein